MEIIELDIKIPYEHRGDILRRIYPKVRGKIKDIHFLPPTSRGISEIKMELKVENVQRFIEDLHKIVKSGRIAFKVLTEA